jgi:hypothetical protein
MMYLVAHYPMLVGILLLLSELAAAVSQLLYPTNSGLNGVLASFIKLLQGLKDSQPKNV